ncbi:sulfite exporter TauE/SafE family protein [Qipengyuania sediminis]|uniref:sulfite exporter TauE/SafE family protein n=1 Tax=Qipengyuania sediminis TaxID=1532023 RepID=UPI001059CF74|nr:sulfite exporter TauE/SafE family protein [Qipengyuania sediminis]
MEFGAFDLGALLPFILIGFAAQLVDGAVGMAFGVIMNTLLVGVLGVPPATASKRVHVVECFTTFASAMSHLYHRNIDKALFLRLLLPGVAGGVTGAYLLSNIDGGFIKPFILAYLTLIGLYLLYRGLTHPPAPRPARVVAPLGLVGGFLDAMGGGGWGPVVTSNLLVQGAEPRRVVGTVSAVEFFLTVAISATFISQIGVAELAGATLGLLIGGVLGAPLGAWAAKHIPTKWMLILVGIVLTLTSGYGAWSAFVR